MSPAPRWTAWWLPKGTIRTISRVEIISFTGVRSWTPSLCRDRSRISCSASTLSPTCGRALGFLRTINREGLHFRWRNRYTQSYILKWLNRGLERTGETLMRSKVRRNVGLALLVLAVMLLCSLCRRAIAQTQDQHT